MFSVLLCNVSMPEHAAEAGGEDDTLSMKTVRRIACEIGLGRKAQNVLACLIENRRRIVQMVQHVSLSERIKVRFALDSGEAAVGVCLLAIADTLAADSSSACQGTPQRVMDVAYDLCVYILGSQDLHTAAPLLTGDDVISSLGLGAGPRIGDILRQAAQLERDGILQNRKAALLWLGNLPHNA
jgi:hypothetical protein